MAARVLHIRITARVDGGRELEAVNDVPVSPDYDERDLAALTVRKIEDTAFALNRKEFGRAPTLQALVAAAARLKAIEGILDGPDGIVPRELRIRAVLALTNDDATAAYGEAPEG